MKRFMALLPILGLLALTLGLGLGLQRPSRPTPPPQVGRSMPDFALPPLPGRPQGLNRAALIGKPAVVNFFASWCGYCRAEHPLLQQLAKEGGVPVYGIAWKDDPKRTEKYLADYGNPYTSIGMDRQGRGVIAWGITGTPETFVIDAKGIIRHHHIGPIIDDQDYRTVLSVLQQLTAEGGR